MDKDKYRVPGTASSVRRGDSQSATPRHTHAPTQRIEIRNASRLSSLIACCYFVVVAVVKLTINSRWDHRNSSDKSTRTSILKMATTASEPTGTATAVDAAPGPIYIDTQHEDTVHDTQLDYYGSKLATCSSGTFVLLIVDLPVFQKKIMLTSQLDIIFLANRPHCQNLQYLRKFV